MKLRALSIEGAWVAESPVWPDNRGFFREWFQREAILEATGIDFSVVQANFSLSNQGVIRGIHYSLALNGQAKWVTCVSGSVTDVVVDLRIDSPTFKSVQYVSLEAGDGKAVLIGPGLGHGFFSKEDNSGVAYLLNSPYEPSLEFDISPTDPDLLISWSEKSNKEVIPVVSIKDSLAPTLRAREEQGKLPQKKSLA
jgi:dTDP-4-dehydrorhamnose 3,5-epimerase